VYFNYLKYTWFFGKKWQLYLEKLAECDIIKLYKIKIKKRKGRKNDDLCCHYPSNFGVIQSFMDWYPLGHWYRHIGRTGYLCLPGQKI